MGAWFRWIKQLRENLWNKLEGVKAGIVGGGTTYFVEGNNGSDANHGLTREAPLLTIAHALDLCVSGNDDYIIVLDHYQETFPITVNKAKVHIIGVNVGQPMVWLTAALDTAIFEIEADNVEIAGFEFGPGASHAGIEFTANAEIGYGRIHDCAFGWMQAGQDGIWVPVTSEAAETIIEKCLFGNNLTRDGIRIDHNMTRGIIQDNIFRSVAGVGINVLGQMALGTIRRNKFMLPANTAGAAITLSAACAGIFVEDNDANFGDTAAMGLIPWVVTGGAADANCFDNNKRGGVVIFPA